MNNILKDKSYNFALRIIKLSRYLQDEKKEFILSKQILRSGTSIGALISESEYAQSKADFISKLHISIKEANVKTVIKCKLLYIFRFGTETVVMKWSRVGYWLNLLNDSNYITDKMFKSIEPEIIELLKLLTSSIKTSKENNV